MKKQASRVHRCCRRMILVMCFSVGVQAAPPQPAVQDAEPAPIQTLEAQCGSLFQDHAVLQQQIPLPVWGTSLPGAAVTVHFDGQTKRTTADTQGGWKVTLDPMTAVKLKSVNDTPEGKTLTISCKLDSKEAVTTFQDIVVGEVWIGAGQSNMAGKMGTGTSRHYPEDSIATANYPGLRHIQSAQRGPWLVCSPETAPSFKKVCFFFGRRLQRDIRVPVGLVSAAVGGSRIETWLNQAPFERGKNFDMLIAPVAGYGIRGVLWYQGESNANDRRAYLPKLRSLIVGWRDVWGQGDFPFYFVQLPGIGTSPTDHPAGGDGRAEIRQAQFEALALAHTGMAVTKDGLPASPFTTIGYDDPLESGQIAEARDMQPRGD